MNINRSNFSQVCNVLVTVIAIAILLNPGANQARGQQPAASPEPAANTAAKTAQTQNLPKSYDNSTTERFRIGPGDILDIRVLNRPNLSRDNVRVEANGTIRMPLIEGEIGAACLTETELGKEITQRYLKYYRNPQVDVFVKEYHSTQVAIIGAVKEQGRFLLQRRIRLLELLTYAKGTDEKVGRTINVVHSSTAFQCGRESNEESTGMASFRLGDTLRGEESSNPYLENGDIVTLPEADQVYVVGNVLQPKSILLKDPVTLTRAIAMAGGLNKDTRTEKIRIVRQEPGSTTKKEIYVDLATIEKKRAEDPILIANDIVDVPVSGTKSLLRSMIGSLAPAVSQMPVRVIP